MSSIPVSYSKSVGVRSCVSIIAQSCAIGKVYLISRLHSAPWNCYFLSKLLFQSLYFLKFLTYTLSQELLFQRIQFFRTANFQQLTSWSFQILKYPGGGGNQQFKTCYSSLQYILLKMTLNLPLKWKISTRAITLFRDPFWRLV